MDPIDRANVNAKSKEEKQREEGKKRCFLYEGFERKVVSSCYKFGILNLNSFSKIRRIVRYTDEFL